jgi:hypothetical protein
MLQKLIEKLRPWEEALAGLDDPHGDCLLILEDRISRLEGEVERLRGSVAMNDALLPSIRSFIDFLAAEYRRAGSNGSAEPPA